ncbi:hypothetical protein AALO_G00192160 [Alosa alosa]|uniref:Uncharacterized protein n=1 Tax=Alosa alosa TaxID=278164 RepID=A0AAV6G5K4_9TELE|nr:hypothetical protein AALO_G00192160 [Alosa alosa]
MEGALHPLRQFIYSERKRICCKAVAPAQDTSCGSADGTTPRTVSLERCHLLHVRPGGRGDRGHPGIVLEECDGLQGPDCAMEEQEALQSPVLSQQLGTMPTYTSRMFVLLSRPPATEARTTKKLNGSICALQ